MNVTLTEEWKYVDDGYVQCPDCFESMTDAGRDEPRNHSPDCEYIGLCEQND